MLTLSDEKRLKLLDLIESVVNKQVPEAHMIEDPQVVYQFLFLSKDTPELVYAFLTLLQPKQWSLFTEQDVLTEEVMLELYLLFGFSDQDMVAWLRDLSYGAVEFFKSIATDKNLMRLDDLIYKSRYHVHMIDGLTIDSLPKYFENLPKLVTYGLNQWITFKQFRIILGELSPTESDLKACFDDLIESHYVLGKITRSSQELPFRIFCAMFDYFPDTTNYMAGVFQVVDQFLLHQSVEKTAAFINLLPYPVIKQLVDRYIVNDQRDVLDYFDDQLPQFNFGSIRKIVRRHQLKVNYKHG